MRAPRPVSRPEWTALAALLLFTVVAIGGYWNFALHPERLARYPGAMDFYARSFPFFARAHIAVSAMALGVVLVRRLRAAWIPAALAVLGISFLSEHVGTGYGIPFGGYGYTAMLGPKVGGRVPALIPLSWFLMALPSWILARAALGGRGGAMGRVALGAVWLTVWDLALDPAMSFLTTYWVWEESGPYYGMPWLNLVGWYVTGLALMAALEVALRRVEVDRVPVRWTAAYYGAVVLMPLGMLIAAGHWLAVGVTLGAVAATAALGWAVGRKAERLEETPDAPSATSPAPGPPVGASMGAR